MPAPNLPHEIVEMMGSREHRMHHYLWHNVRESWHRYSQATRDGLAALGWEPPRPSLTPDGNPDVANGSGEDFLYMHREMIGAVNRRLAEVGDADYPRIEGWVSPPGPDDADWPVPPPFPLGGDADALVAVKSDAFHADPLMRYAAALTDEDRLRGWTLGHFGALVEYSVHNWMHMRWCAAVPEPRPENDDNAPDGVDPEWDDLAYDWLGDTYSSHVNPVFWKLHGWVDSLIDRWAAANGVVGPIPWTGTWTGPFPAQPAPDSFFAAAEAVRRDPAIGGAGAAGLRAGAAIDGAHHGHEHGGHQGHHGARLTAAARLVRDSGIECHFYDRVPLPEL